MQSFSSKQNSEIHAKTIFQRMPYVTKCVNVSWRMLTHKSATEKFWCIFNWRNKTLICYYCMYSNNNKWTYFYNVERWPIENAESCKLEEIQNFIVFVFLLQKILLHNSTLFAAWFWSSWENSFFVEIFSKFVLFLFCRKDVEPLKYFRFVLILDLFCWKLSEKKPMKYFQKDE